MDKVVVAPGVFSANMSRGNTRHLHARMAQDISVDAAVVPEKRPSQTSGDARMGYSGAAPVGVN